MERLVIEIPEKRSTLIKQLLTELGAVIKQENPPVLSDRKKRLANISVWSDDDLKVFEESKQAFNNWKPEEW